MNLEDTAPPPFDELKRCQMKLRRVQQLHRVGVPRADGWGGGRGRCMECGKAWPCPTGRAAGEDDDS